MRHTLIGVIGAGVMGSGLAQCLAQSGLHVLLVDISDASLDRAKQEIRKGLRLQRLLGRANRDASPEEIVQRITYHTDIEALHPVGFIIENVTEDWEIKKVVYQQLDAICHAEVIFAANTSVISINRIAALTRRAPKVIGMHFMNPVPLKNTVELIRGDHTSQETIVEAEQLLSSIGKQSILVKDSPGFVTNRMLMPFINEAIYLFEEGVASVEEIDALCRACFEHRQGPLETADLIGLDTVLLSIEELYESLKEGKYRPCPLLKEMVAAGHYGRKSGKGFYTYNE